MKTLTEIKQAAESGDYQRVADIVKMSADLVKKVVVGDRRDHHNIQRTFSDLLEARERLASRESRRRERKAKAAKANACLTEM
jgi:hypothetical protein